MSDTPAPPRLWDAKEVAHFLNVSRNWVYARAQAGLLPYLQIGGLLRFEPEAIHAYAKAGAHRSKLEVLHQKSSRSGGGVEHE